MARHTRWSSGRKLARIQLTPDDVGFSWTLHGVAGRAAAAALVSWAGAARAKDPTNERCARCSGVARGRVLHSRTVRVVRPYLAAAEFEMEHAALEQRGCKRNVVGSFASSTTM
jgi:hypothetical protein